MRVAVLGAGAYGTALGGLLKENLHEVVYYDPLKDSDNTNVYTDLAEALNMAETIVLCAPSKVTPELLIKLPKEVFMIVATKGFLTEEPFDDFADWAVLSGPGYADDIKAKKTTNLTATDKRIMKMLDTDYLDFDYTEDRKGVLMCGTLKNVYALWAGFCMLKPDTEVHEKYLREVANEMRKILSVNGADPRTVDLNCGIGDLRLSCYLPSRNYEFGRELLEHPETKPNRTVEGLTALEHIKQGVINLPSDLPYLESLMKESEKWH